MIVSTAALEVIERELTILEKQRIELNSHIGSARATLDKLEGNRDALVAKIAELRKAVEPKPKDKGK